MLTKTIRTKLLAVCCALIMVSALMPTGSALARRHNSHGRGHSHGREGGEGALLPSGQILSTIAANGDQNPYGAAYVPQDFAQGGSVNPGDLLISNFNNSSNSQGMGTTIVDIAPNGQLSTFFQGGPGIGLTLALGTLRRGFVVVGSVPTLDGTSATVQQGSLLIVDDNGHLTANLTDATFLDGPWGLAINDQGDSAQIFVANVLNGTVSRLDCQVDSGGVTVNGKTTIGSGYAHRTDPSAIVIGPTGLAYDSSRDILYVASTADNQIFALTEASEASSSEGMRDVIFSDNTHLHGPLGLALLPNGHLITTNGDAVNPDPNQSSEIVEFTPDGDFVSQFQLDPAPDAGFGIAVEQSDATVTIAADNDNHNTVQILGLHF
jgi:sugar lactone lactonase YvrE